MRFEGCFEWIEDDAKTLQNRFFNCLSDLRASVQNKILLEPIWKLGFSSPVLRRLRSGGIEYVVQLVQLVEDELKFLHGGTRRAIGKKWASEIEFALASNNLHLGADEDDPEIILAVIYINCFLTLERMKNKFAERLESFVQRGWEAGNYF
jgi:hypothetical protein